MKFSIAIKFVVLLSLGLIAAIFFQNTSKINTSDASLPVEVSENPNVSVSSSTDQFSSEELPIDLDPEFSLFNFDEIVRSSCSADYRPQRISRNNFFDPPIRHVSKSYNDEFSLPKTSEKVFETRILSKIPGFSVESKDSAITVISDGSEEAKIGGFIQLEQLFLDKVTNQECTRSFFIFVKEVTKNWQHSIQWVSGGTGSGMGALSLPYGSTTFKTGDNEETFFLTDCSLNLVHKIQNGVLGYLLGENQGRGNKLGQLNTPADIKVNPYDGNFYIADDRNHRIQIFDPDGKFVNLFGAAGTAGGDERTDLGYFRNPLSIEFVGGQIVVSDSTNHRVQFRDNKDNWRAIGVNGGDGTSGSGPGEFSGPYYMVRNANDNLLVVDRSNHRIQILDSQGNFISEFGSNGSGKSSSEKGLLDYPHELDIDTNGHIFVTDTNNDRVNIYGENGNFINDIYFPGFALPKVVATSKIDSRNIYMAFVGGNRVAMKIRLRESYLSKTEPADNFSDAKSESDASNADPLIPLVKSAISLSNSKIEKGAIIFKKRCAICHTNKDEKIPQLGDSNEWSKRSANGIEPLIHSVLNGKGLMPVRAGCESCSDDELHNAIEFMLSKSANLSSGPTQMSIELTVRQQWLATANRNVQGLDSSIDKTGSAIFLAAEGYSSSGRSFDDKFGQKQEFSTHSPEQEQNALTGDVAITADGNYAFTVYRNGNVHIFNAAGESVKVISSFGKKKDQLNHPLGIISLENGNIVVADSQNTRLQEFALSGEWIRSIGSGNLEFPYDLKFFQGKFYVSDRQANKIVVLDNAGKLSFEFDSVTMPDGSKIQLDQNQGIDFDSSGNLYIINSGAKNIIVATANGKGRAILNHKYFGWVRQIEILPDDSFLVSVLTDLDQENPGNSPGGIVHFEPVW